MMKCWKTLVAATFSVIVANAAVAQTASPSAPKGGTMTINLLGPITSASMAEVVRTAQDAVLVGVDELQISISSGGGKVYAARFAVNALRALPIKISTVAMSDVSSSAVALFCAGETRYVAPGATIYLHQLTRFAERSVKTAAAQEREDAIVHGWYNGMLKGCLSDPESISEISHYQDRDLILTDEDAYRLGMGTDPFSDLKAKQYFGRAINIVPNELGAISATSGRR